MSPQLVFVFVKKRDPQSVKPDQTTKPQPQEQNPSTTPETKRKEWKVGRLEGWKTGRLTPLDRGQREAPHPSLGDNKAVGFVFLHLHPLCEPLCVPTMGNQSYSHVVPSHGHSSLYKLGGGV